MLYSLLPLAALGLAGCRVGCDFEPHCEGNVVMDCSVGIDQLDRCEGPLRVYCNERLGWVQAVDCTALQRPGCSVDPTLGRAVCD